MFNSWKHIMIGVGRVLWRSSGPNPLLKLGHMKPVAHEHVSKKYIYNSV